MRFVDISGFGHSGKSVITDLLREFKGYQVPNYNFEFNLIRIQGGLIDLRYALIDNWSPIRSDAAIRRFLKLVKRIGPRARFSDPCSLFLSNGMNYDDYFAHAFTPISKEYIESLLAYTYIGEWPYPMIEEPTYKRFLQRLCTNLKIKNKFLQPVYVAAPNDFIEKTRAYLNKLFKTIQKNDTRVMVTLNSLEPFNPKYGIELFDDMRLIVVQRDPRDIYASSLLTEEGFNPKFETADHWKLKRDFLNVDSVDRFIERQHLYYKQVNWKEDTDKVLRLRYEDVVLNYDITLERIYQFLGEAHDVHIQKGKYFNPSLSEKNIGIWKKLKDQDAIRKIEASLGNFCFN